MSYGDLVVEHSKQKILANISFHQPVSLPWQQFATTATPQQDIHMSLFSTSMQTSAYPYCVFPCCGEDIVAEEGWWTSELRGLAEAWRDEVDE